MSQLSFEELERIYKKLTQHFLFNIYSISEEIDVFVAFETMNNRGKPLSHLELLKNRLIYLSTKFDVADYEIAKLRKAINECWKSMYHNLGKNKSRPLDDDTFLFNHFAIRFGNTIGENERKGLTSLRRYGIPRIAYQDYLLEQQFTFKNISTDTENNEDRRLTVSDIYSYVQSLKESVEIWYQLLNPEDSKFSQEEIFWLEKLNRIGIVPVASLLMVFFQKETSQRTRIRLLKALERYLFIIQLPTPRIGKFYLEVQDTLSFAKGETSSEKLIKDIEQSNEELLTSNDFMQQLTAGFKSIGFYQWRNIRYFLYEYELELQEKSKTYRQKIDWEILTQGTNSLLDK